MKKLLLWVLLCLPALAYAQTTEQTKFLGYFPDISTNLYKGSKLNKENVLNAKQCALLYSESTIKAEGENLIIYPIAKFKHSEQMYSLIYLEVQRMIDYCKGKTCYMGSLTIKTFVFDKSNVTEKAYPLVGDSGYATATAILEQYEKRSIALATSFAPDEMWFVDANNYETNIKKYKFNQKEKQYELSE